MGGIVTFAGVAIFLTSRQGGLAVETTNEYLLLSVLGLFGIGLLTAYPLVRRFKLGQLRDRWRGTGDLRKDPKLFAEFTNLTIVGAAMAEGFSLFSLVIFLVTGHPLGLAGGAIGLLGVARFFPTTARLDSFAAAVSGG